MHTAGGTFLNYLAREMWAPDRVKGGHHTWDPLQNSAGDTGVLWRWVPQFVSCPLPPRLRSPGLAFLIPNLFFFFFDPKLLSF